MTQGRTLGGSSSINDMIYDRGLRADFDNGTQRGNRGRGYVDVLPCFKRTERRTGIGDDRIHGRTGKLPVTDIDWIHPVCEAFIAARLARGFPVVRTTTAVITRKVSVIFSVRSIMAIAIPPHACSCILHARHGGWKCAPTRAAGGFCSMARVPLACVTWTIATARRGVWSTHGVWHSKHREAAADIWSRPGMAAAVARHQGAPATGARGGHRPLR